MTIAPNVLNQYNALGSDSIAHDAAENVNVFGAVTFVFDALGQLIQASAGGRSRTFGYELPMLPALTEQMREHYSTVRLEEKRLVMARFAEKFQRARGPSGDPSGDRGQKHEGRQEDECLETA